MDLGSQQVSRSGPIRKVGVVDLSKQLVPYMSSWQIQRKIVNKIQQEVKNSQSSIESTSGVLILLQHPPVFTFGAGSTEDNVKFSLQNPPCPIFRTERGGEVTYHGPGQLVAYPILNLKHFHQDLHWLMRALEECAIISLQEVSGIQGQRIADLTGVWVNSIKHQQHKQGSQQHYMGDSQITCHITSSKDRNNQKQADSSSAEKIAAIGVRASRWVSYHGLAMNILCDLQPFGDIVPCGIDDKGVTSVSNILGNTADLQNLLVVENGRYRDFGQQNDNFKGVFDLSKQSAYNWNAEAGGSLCSRFGESRHELVDEYAYALRDAFGQVFGAELVDVDLSQYLDESLTRVQS